MWLNFPGDPPIIQSSWLDPRKSGNDHCRQQTNDRYDDVSQLEKIGFLTHELKGRRTMTLSLNFIIYHYGMFTFLTSKEDR